MVLPSQFGSSESRGRYMVSRRRRGSRWPWVTLVLLAVVLIGYFAFGGSGDKSSEPVEAGMAATETDRTPPTTVPAAGIRPAKPAKAAPLPPSRVAQPPPQVKSVAVVPKRVRKNKPTAPAKRAPTILGQQIAQGLGLISRDKLVEGRHVLNDLLTDPGRGLSPGQAEALRGQLARVNEQLLFSKRVAAGDPLISTFVVKSGDRLGKIAPKYNITYQLIERINQVKATRIRPGQRLKVIKGPFHAVVSKAGFRMDLYLTGPGSKPMYVRSFPVGLGEDDSTPLGRWIVRQDYKIKNPAWTNPRTSKQYARNDANNPIGEYWIGLQGTDDNTRDLRAYGIHGTIEPQTIGKQASMGCIRLRPNDIELLYAMLVEGKSQVEVRR